MFSAGDIAVATVRFGETGEAKTRLVLVLYEELYSVVVAAITSNPLETGVPLTKREGAPRECVIKLNYIFTLTTDTLSKPLFRLGREKRKLVFSELLKLLSGLQE